MLDAESRVNLGSTEYLLHRINGEHAWVTSSDAHRVVRDHSQEWATRPFPADVQKEARQRMLFTA